MNREQMIEVVARALCERHIREVRRWDTNPAELDKMIPDCVDYSWRDFVRQAHTILAAIETAGGLIVPKKPDLRMLEAATNRCQDGKCVEWTAMCYGNAIELYDTMLAASPMQDGRGA